MPKSKNTTGKNWVDPDDAPQLDRTWFQQADVYKGAKLVRRGRPPSASAKAMIAFRFAPDLLAHIKASGRGYNARVEKILREAVEEGRL